MSTDEWLVCLIYVLTRANLYEMPAYLALMNSFILVKKKEQSEMLLCNLQAALELTVTLDELKEEEPQLDRQQKTNKVQQSQGIGDFEMQDEIDVILFSNKN